MSIVKLGAALAAACVMIAALPGAASASEITDAFLANVRPNVSFLDQSSRIAALRAGSELARVYARGEAAVTTEVAANDDTVVTGRSAARDGFGQAANGRTALGPKDVLELGALSGKAFDDLYWEKQLDALSQLAADYRAYAAGGDNPALVAMAKRELPRVEDRLKALSAI